MKTTITKHNFLQWYFSGDDQWQSELLYSLGELIKYRLLDYPNSVFSIDVHEIFEEACIDGMPVSLLEEFSQDDTREIFEVKEIEKIELI